MIYQLGNRPKTKAELYDVQADHLRRKTEPLTYCEIMFLNLYDDYQAMKQKQEKDKKEAN